VYFDQLILKVANIRLEIVEEPYLNGEEVMVALLELLKGRALSKKQLGESFEAVN